MNRYYSLSVVVEGLWDCSFVWTNCLEVKVNSVVFPRPLLSKKLTRV